MRMSDEAIAKLREDTGVPVGKCLCGCGEKTTVAKKTNSRQRRKKGVPVNFIHGHATRVHNPGAKKLEDHWKWNGGRRENVLGYVLVKRPGHHAADTHNYVREHILVAEEALGKRLPEAAVIHHVNEKRNDNRPENLVVCENHDYHMFLHRRMRAREACGNATWLKCGFCKKYDDPENLRHVERRRKSGHIQRAQFHPSCRSRYGKGESMKEIEAS